MHARFGNYMKRRLSARSPRHAQLRRDLWTFIAMLWLPVAAFAAPIAGMEVVMAISPALAIAAIALSTLSGATALATRIDRELSDAPNKKMPRLWLTCTAHMLGSWLAGSLGFVLAQGQEMSIWLGLGLVIAASFTGAKFIEGITEKYMGKALPDAPTGGT